MTWTCNAYAEMLIQRAEAKRAAEQTAAEQGKQDPPKPAAPPVEEFTTEALLKILNG